MIGFQSGLFERPLFFWGRVAGVYPRPYNIGKIFFTLPF